MNFETKSYKARLVKCPKCLQILEYEGYSETSINSAVHDLYDKLESHLKERCFCRNSKSEKYKLPITIFIKKENKHWTFTDEEKNHFLSL